MDIPRSPLVRDPSAARVLSLVVAILMAATSLAGLLLPSVIYPTETLRRSLLANDVINLFIGLPLLLGAIALAQRGSLLGLLFWPGALYYITYNYIAYAVAMPLTWQFVPYLGLVILSACAILLFLSAIDPVAVRARLEGRVSERVAGGALIVFGLLISLMAVGALAGVISGQATTPWPEVALRIADLLVAPTWFAGGVFLWRRQPFGYVAATGLLFQASMLFVGLLVFFILQPYITGVPFPVNDFIVVAVMSLICFIPFGLFLRGAVSRNL